MKRIIISVLIGGIGGLAIGYFVFGEIAGAQISIQTLLPSGSSSGLGGAIRNAASDLVGIDEIRRKILLAGAGGAGLGLVAAVMGARK